MYLGLKQHAALQEHIFTIYQSLEVNTGITKTPKKEIEEDKGKLNYLITSIQNYSNQIKLKHLFLYQN